MKKGTVVILVALMEFVASSRPVIAQEGFKLGIDFPVGSFPFGDISFVEGIGGGFRIGYGLDHQASLWLGLALASHTVRNGVVWIGDPTNAFTDWDFGWVNLELKYLFEAESSVKPFVLAGLGVAVLSADSDNSLTGGALTGGGGAEYVLNEHWALNMMGAFHFSRLTLATVKGQSGKLSNPMNEHAFTANIGILYHF